MDIKPTYEELEESLSKAEKSIESLKKSNRNLLTDITEHKVNEQALIESEERFRQITESIQEVFWICSSDWKQVHYISPAYEKVWGRSCDSLYENPRSWREAIVEEDREKVISYLNDKVSGDLSEIVFPEYRIAKPDGTFRSILARGFKILDEDGNTYRIAGIAEDITDRKKTEEELQKLGSVLKHSSELVNLATLEGKMTFLNEAGRKMLGIEPDEIEQFSIMDVIPGHLTELVQNELLPMLMEGGTWEGDLQYRNLKTGNLTDVHAMTFTVQEHSTAKPLFLANVSLDITKRKQVEKELRKSEKRYRSFIDNAPIAMYTINTKGELTYGNRKLLEMTGYKQEDWLNKPFTPIVHPEDLSIALEKIQKRISGQGTQDPYEVRIFHASGEIIWVKITSESIYETDDNGKKRLIGMQSFVEDITSRKVAEDAQQESEDKFRNLFELSPQPITLTELETSRLVDVNDKHFELTKFNREEILGKTAIEMGLFTEEGKELFRKELNKSGEVNGLEMDFRAKDGAVLTALMFSRIVQIAGESFILTIFHDITDEKRLKNQLRHAQKMEAIGTLAGGVAHDFNNLLMGIQGRTSLMIMDTGASHPYFDHLKGIEEYVKSATDLTKQLLGFARGGRYEVKPTNLNELLIKGSDMFSRTKKEISIHRKYQEDVWTVDVDQGQIEQVLLNLYVNAWQSMPGGGELYLETENVLLDENYTKLFDFEPGQYVKISVTDTGVGMDKATRDRIFDPFFTTKEMGRGTGLGLASAYGIIKNHEGIINVYSEKGEGTTFNIYLPASEKEIIKEEESIKELIKGTETILLVDDEDMILDIGKELLKRMGYRVLIAKSGKEAIECYNAHKDAKDAIDIVILDMIMPEMGGGKTYDRLKEINADIKVLLSSGYSINGQATEILNRGCNGFIQKPFSIKQLSQKLREILE